MAVNPYEKVKKNDSRLVLITCDLDLALSSAYLRLATKTCSLRSSFCLKRISFVEEAALSCTS